jgi:phage terminase large subunit GpA-like protein
MRHNKVGPGYVHFGLAGDDEWCSQVTSEKQQLRYVKGFPVREWIKSPSARNEALDCMVYAYAALQLASRRYAKATMWERLGEQLQVAKEQQMGSVALKEETPRRRRSFRVI